MTPENFSDDSRWLCTNIKTGYATKINGSLASILSKYPQDYKLKFIGSENGNKTVSERNSDRPL